MEIAVLKLAMGLYAAGAAPVLLPLRTRRAVHFWYLLFTSLALAVHGAAIVLDWIRVGHGPFVTLFDILSSNIWSLCLVHTVAYRWYREVRESARAAVTVIMILVLWLALTEPVDRQLPPTYDTFWLYCHVLSGKLFLGLLLVAMSLSFQILLRGWTFGTLRPDAPPMEDAAARRAYVFLACAFVFESAMLLFGAVWAQDAWGRYWAWDPLETWSFVTWLSVAFVLHLRTMSGMSERVVAVLTIVCFVLAFLTFFGVPFISVAPHKGVV